MNAQRNLQLPLEYWNKMKENRHRILRIIAVCCVLSLLSYMVLPKKYKVSAMIALQSQYFQLPLVNGFLPETLDPGELRSKREALLHLALNQKFLIDLAGRYNLLKDPSNNHELELFAKKFEVIPNGPSTFVINFTAKDPEIAYQVLQDFLSHLRAVMTDERHAVLLNLHDAIQEQLETISFGSQGENPSTLYAARPDLVQRRIEKIQEEVETLKNSYSEKHPRIAALNEQLSRLAQWNRPITSEAALAPRRDVFAGVKVEETSKELFDDLLKKYRYLEVVLYMDQQRKDNYLSYLTEPFVPESPTWPKLPLLLIWGVALGFLIGAVSVLVKEFPFKFKQPMTTSPIAKEEGQSS